MFDSVSDFRHTFSCHFFPYFFWSPTSFTRCRPFQWCFLFLFFDCSKLLPVIIFFSFNFFQAFPIIDASVYRAQCKLIQSLFLRPAQALNLLISNWQIAPLFFCINVCQADDQQQQQQQQQLNQLYPLVTKLKKSRRSQTIIEEKESLRRRNQSHQIIRSSSDHTSLTPLLSLAMCVRARN